MNEVLTTPECGQGGIISWYCKKWVSVGAERTTRKDGRCLKEVSTVFKLFQRATLGARHDTALSCGRKV